MIIAKLVLLDGIHECAVSLSQAWSACCTVYWWDHSIHAALPSIWREGKRLNLSTGHSSSI